MTIEESATLEPYSLSSVLFSYLWVYRILFPSASTLYHHLPPPHLVTPAPAPSFLISHCQTCPAECLLISLAVIGEAWCQWNAAALNLKHKCFDLIFLCSGCTYHSLHQSRLVWFVPEQVDEDELCDVNWCSITGSKVNTHSSSLANCVINDIIYIVGESVSSHV